ncbi:MAG: hypothetical protein ACRC62_14675 [Microcoleus sp.]
MSKITCDADRILPSRQISNLPCFLKLLSTTANPQYKISRLTLPITNQQSKI